MRIHVSLALLLALVCALAGCLVEVGPEEEELGEDGAREISLNNLDKTLRRAVIGRMYQKHHWMIPAADAYKPSLYPDLIERRIQYVCDTLVKLRPTYVSSLIRLDAAAPLTPEQVQTFRGVKQCVRKQVSHPVRFDVQLNALHYADPSFVAGPDAGAALLRKRLREVSDQLNPEIVFFDFYTVPFNKTDKTYYPGAMRAGIKWIHQNNQLVAGNVWGNNLPDGTDFAMLVDKGDMGKVRDQAAALRKKSSARLLMHIRNDPHIPGSLGLTFITGSLDTRKEIVRRHASKQAEHGYAYMYPVFFPLYEPALRRAYDARQDGNMLGVVGNLLDRY